MLVLSPSNQSREGSKCICNWHADQGPGLAAGNRLLRKHHSDPLTDFMRGEVTQRLGVIPEDVQWGSQAQDVFAHLAGDFMVDSIASVDAVLDAGALPICGCWIQDFYISGAGTTITQPHWVGNNVAPESFSGPSQSGRTQRELLVFDL